LVFLIALASGKADSFEGIVSATLTRAGTDEQHFIFTRKGDQLRIENTTNKVSPINLVDLAAHRLTIVYPHNTTFVVIDLAKKQTSQTNVASSPTMPSMPQMPAAGMPMIPPAMPNMAGATELKESGKTKKIQEFDCTLYTGSDRGQKFEIWATNDSALFPFRLIERDSLGQRFGRRMIEESWPEKLREKSLFPLEFVLKMEPGGQERLSFRIDKIEKKKIDDANLFQPPEKYIETQAPQV